MFNGLPKHCRARCATPHGVVGAAASPTATDREPPHGVRGRGRECPRAIDMEALTGLGGIREGDRAECGNKLGTALPKSPLSKARPME